MFDPLLQTKLTMPPARPDRVSRPRLLEKLALKPQTKLVLVSAPAGYGKTTLLADWRLQMLASAPSQPPDQTPHFCWLSLSEDESDPQTFFRYLAAAVRPLPDSQSQLAQLLQANQPLPAKTLAKAFIHDVTPVSIPFILVLDDYHAINAAEVDEALTAVLDWLPPQMTLALTSRSDPDFPIPRLRARGELIEIRTEDLRFSEAEAAHFLQQSMELTLAPEQIALLESRTEGWIAGLQMAALSLQNRDDAADFVATFSGGHRYIFDYLVDEVLAQQPETVREFLRKTAVLSHLRADLCDALLEIGEGRLETTQSPISNSQSQSILEQLDTAHLFITPLDDRREWYRYHPLFADVLRQQLTDDEQQTQHRRAAQWFAKQAMLPEAIHHTLAARDMDNAAQLIQQAAHATLLRGAHQTLQRWFNALPADMVRSESLLAMYQGWLYFISGQIEEAAAFAQAANRNLPAAAPLVQRGRLDCLRAWLALHQDTAETAVSLAQTAIQNLGDNDKQFRTLAAVVLGEAHDMMGDTQAAVTAYRDGVGDVAVLDDTVISQVALLRLAVGLNDTGRRREALALAERNFRVGSRSLLLLATGALAFEANQLDTAVHQLRAGLEAANQLNIGGGLLYGKHVLAQVQLAQGEWEAARHTASRVGEMGRAQQSSFYINWAAAFLARIQMQSGREAVRLDEINASPEKTPLLWQEPTYIFATRQLLAQARPDEALRLLTQLETSVRRGGRERMRLTILLRQALAYQMKNDETNAATRLQEALQLAAPEGYLRAFLDEGEGMMRLLKQNLSRLSETAVLQFAGQILAAAGEAATSHTLPEPLTARELDILRLVAAGRSNAEIGEHLFLSLNTVKWHLKNIYAKLHVHNRVEAATRARELNLI